jgi:hypothetical protein
MNRFVRRALVASLVLALAAACGEGLSVREAVQTVRRYMSATTDAYRAGDASGVSAVAGLAEAKRLAALVGTKGDMGLTMDAVLLDLQVERVEPAGEGVRVDTRERWRWRDLRIGTGEQVGPTALDRYHLRYQLARVDRRWLVSSVEFLEPPQTDRMEPARAPASSFH